MININLILLIAILLLMLWIVLVVWYFWLAVSLKHSSVSFLAQMRFLYLLIWRACSSSRYGSLRHQTSLIVRVMITVLCLSIVWRNRALKLFKLSNFILEILFFFKMLLFHLFYLFLIKFYFLLWIIILVYFCLKFFIFFLKLSYLVLSQSK